MSPLKIGFVFLAVCAALASAGNFFLMQCWLKQINFVVIFPISFACFVLHFLCSFRTSRQVGLAPFSRYNINCACIANSNASLDFSVGH